MEPMSEADSTVQGFSHSPDSACERCGSFEVMEIAGKFLCADCVALAGCGCAGHGGGED
jgi:hypothetical protein